MKRSFLAALILFTCCIQLSAKENADMVLVPDVIGMNVKSAELVIKKAGLKVKAITIEECGEAETVIKIFIDEKPIKAWRPAKKGTTIILGIAKEAALDVKIPDIEDKSHEDTEKIIKQQKTETEKVLEKTGTVPETVIEQAQSVQQQVPAGTAINVVLAKEEIIELPTIIGLTQQKATEILKELGLKAKINTVINNENPEGVVIKVIAAKKLLKGDVVTLQVATPQSITAVLPKLKESKVKATDSVSFPMTPAPILSLLHNSAVSSSSPRVGVHWNVSQIAGATGVLLELSNAALPFKNPGGTKPDPNHSQEKIINSVSGKDEFNLQGFSGGRYWVRIFALGKGDVIIGRASNAVKFNYEGHVIEPIIRSSEAEKTDSE